MRARTVVALLAAALALDAALIHRPAAVRRGGAREAEPYRARGVVHVHTAFSEDGHGTLDDVATAARRAGLDFVVVSDHKADGFPSYSGRRQGVLILGGCEKSTEHGHALVLGAGTLPYRLDGDPANVVRDVRDEGGFVVVAHPTSSRGESRWTASFEGASGMEFMNLGDPEAWPTGSVARLGAVLDYALDPQGALLRHFRFDRSALELWDHERLRRPLAGLLGSDAHDGFRIGRLWVPIPRYEQVFRLGSMHLVLDAPLGHDLDGDLQRVWTALRGGRGYGALDGLADASGFSFSATSGAGRASMGQALALESEVVLKAEVDGPPGTELSLLLDGRVRQRAPRIEYRTREAGSYRVEAYLDPAIDPRAASRPWIVSNPIDLFPSEELEARAGRAAAMPIEDPVEATEWESIDDFAGERLAPAWQVDRSEDAEGSARLEAGALRFDFVLGPGDKTHAAVTDWQPRDMSRASSLRFRVRADRRMRFDLEVRTDDPARPGAVRTFRHSVRAETDWQQVVVPLRSLKTYDRRGGKPALSRVRGIYFHLDHFHLVPGSRGTLFVDDLAVGRP